MAGFQVAMPAAYNRAAAMPVSRPAVNTPTAAPVMGAPIQTNTTSRTLADGRQVDTQRKYNPTTGTWETYGYQQTQGPAMGALAARARGTTGAGTGTSGPVFNPNPVDFNRFFSNITSQLGPPPSPVPLPAREASPNPADRTAAEAAAYGKAKGQIGANSRAALNDLADEMSARGIGGSGMEGALASQIIQTGQGQLGQVAQNQAIDALKRQGEIEDRNYAGGINQRSQDVGYDNAINSARLSAYNTRASLIPMILQMMSRTGGNLY